MTNCKHTLNETQTKISYNLRNLVFYYDKEKLIFELMSGSIFSYYFLLKLYKVQIPTSPTATRRLFKNICVQALVTYINI